MKKMRLSHASFHRAPPLCCRNNLHPIQTASQQKALSQNGKNSMRGSAFQYAVCEHPRCSLFSFPLKSVNRIYPAGALSLPWP